MALTWAEKALSTEAWHEYDQNTSDNLIKDPRIENTDEYIASINDAHETFLNNIEWKSEAVKAQLKLLHIEMIKGSLDEHLETNIPRMIEESMQRLRESKGDHPLDAVEFTDFLQLRVKWLWNNLYAKDIIDIFSKAKELWIDLKYDKATVAEMLNEHLWRELRELEKIKSEKLISTVDYVSNNPTMLWFMSFTTWPYTVRGITENTATEQLIIDLEEVGISENEFLDALEAKVNSNKEAVLWEEADDYAEAMSNTNTESTTEDTTETPEMTTEADEDTEADELRELGIDDTSKALNDFKIRLGDSPFKLVDFKADKAAVESLQAILRIKADGLFGKKTMNAIKVFQEKNGLAADGLPGKKTLTVMIEQHNQRVAQTTLVTDIAKRQEFEDQYDITLTSDNGVFSGDIDGRYMPAMENWEAIFILPTWEKFLVGKWLTALFSGLRKEKEWKLYYNAERSTESIYITLDGEEFEENTTQYINNQYGGWFNPTPDTFHLER